MRSILHRPGLSFEVAPPQPSHPNRTDIACFVGCIRRRAAAQTRRLMPEVLARWIESQPEFRATVMRDQGRLRRAIVQLDSIPAFKASLQEVMDTSAWPEDLDTTALARLLNDCSEYVPVPASIVDALRVAGFYPGGLLGRPASNDPLAISRAYLEGWTRVQRLMNLPVRCETFEVFSALFAWEERAVLENIDPTDPLLVTTAMGVAVRAFFASGGRTCYVIATGGSTALFASAVDRYAALVAEEREQLDSGDGQKRDGSFDLALRVPVLPGAPMEFPSTLVTDVAPSPPLVSTDPSTWRGIEHVFGLDDVSFVIVPDLVDAIATPIPQNIAPGETMVAAETFQECAARPAPVSLPVGRRLPAPYLSKQELAVWKSLLAATRALLDNGVRAFNRRDVQLLASLPLAAQEAGLPRQNDWAAWLAADTRLHSDGIQLAWPWLRTRESGDCQGAVEAPEGTLAGVLSAAAIQLGSYHSAARFPVDRLIDISPDLDLGQATAEAAPTEIGDFTLADRVCLIVPTAFGPVLMSDVTLAVDPLLRAGAVRRLINVVIAQARMIGADLVFDPNGEALWKQITDRLNDLGRLLIAVGAVSSDAGKNAFIARCGRMTMTQADIDAGRAIVEIELVPSQPIVRIVIVLDLRDASNATIGAVDATSEQAA